MISSCNQHKTIVNQILYMHFFSYRAFKSGVYFTLTAHLHLDISSAQEPHEADGYCMGQWESRLNSVKAGHGLNPSH